MARRDFQPSMRKLSLLFLFFGFSLVAFAQETSCTDGIDNDGDGFIDCFDSDCAGNAVCVDNYIGNDSDCQIPQPPGSDFSMVLKNQTTDHVTSTHGRFVIGDMGDPVNGKDGIPEVVTAHTDTKKIYILDGQTLGIKYEATAQDKIDRYDIAIADVANNGCAQIFVAEVGTERVCTRFRSDGSCRTYSNVTKHYVSSWDCQANQVWRREVYGRPFTFGIADFDSDGKAELYYRNEILDAATGQTHIAGSGDWATIDGAPVAVDILDDSECADCAGLELVAGGVIYSVNLNAQGSIDGGTLTAVRRFNDIPGLVAADYWFTKYLDLGGDQFVNSQTSIADFDQDGYLDVLMTGTSNSGKSTIFYWNVRTNQGRLYRPPNNWQYGVGRLNLADLDGDGEMNVAFVSGSFIYALDENLSLMWRIAIDEETSGYTSTTVFDFNNDGASEIVYRDETYLYIIKGDGTFSPPIPCKSLTSNDYPIVADVDADGSTEICVVCQDNFNDSNYAGANEGVIRTYKSGNEPWVSARQVWNQHGYFNVNVNDDLTIPIVQQKHHMVFSTNQCGPGENRVLNSFLNQSAILNSDGCKTYPSADISFLANPNLLNITPPTCPGQDFQVSFTIRNIGSLDLTADIPVTFYSGDPTLAGAIKLGTEIITLTNFQKGDQLVVPNLTVTGTGGAFTLFAVLNDNGSGVPTPVVLPNSGIDECNLGNNIASASVNPQVFQLATSSTDHVQCGAGPSPPNGSARAYKLEGAAEQTVGYTFYWFDGTTAGVPASADHTGSQITGLTNGTYTVYAVHDAYQCSSDTVRVTVGQQEQSISASVNVDRPYTNCNNPDGQLSVTPGSGVVGDYTYEWFEGTVFGTSPVLSDSSVLRFTKALTYSVLVTQISSGCETLESGTVPDQTITPSVTTAVTDANCTPANSGAVSASVAGVTAGYTFYWYKGATAKPTEDFVGATYQNIVAGSYTVIVRNNATGCESGETVATVSTVPGITVTATITAQQTSCATPNGAASANVGGMTAGYEFRWFEGNNTINQIGTDPVITGLSAGSYTVESTRIATGCADTELITVVDNIRMPAVTPSIIANQVDCFPPDGAVTATAAGSPGLYNFYWFDGSVGTPDTTAADHKGATYAGRAAGFYTVVAVDANTRCASSRGLVEVLNQTVTPVINSSTVNQTSCDPLNPNGRASSDVGGVTTNYKFRWFTGSDTTNLIVEQPDLLNQAAGSYTVKAVNRTTGCLATKLMVINDVRAKPTLSLVKQDNSICSSALGYTGGVTASFANNPNGQPAHVYLYKWWRNGVLMAGENGPSIAGLNAGTYAVSVENQSLRCTSDLVSIDVDDAVDLPSVTTVQTSSTNCAGPLANGQARVTDVDGQGAGAPYTFQWHTGADTSSPIAGATSPELLNVQGGAGRNYTVLVTNSSSGCQSIAIVQVADAKALPLFTLAPTPNTICNATLTDPSVPFNGSVTATLTNSGANPLSDYRFDWTDEETNAVIFSAVGGPATSGEELTRRDSGNYTLVVEQISTGCISAPVTAQVIIDADLPVITVDATASTNCDPGLANGRVLVTDVDGSVPSGNYTFQWRKGNTFSGSVIADAVASPDTLQGGAGRLFTVQVTNKSDGCRNTETVEVPDAKILPLFTLATTPNTVCDATLTDPLTSYDGSATATINNRGLNPLSDYRFEWTDEDTNTIVFSAVGGAPGQGEMLTQRDSGYYTLVIRQSSTGCVSAPVTTKVDANFFLPLIDLAATPQTACVGRNGILAATVDETSIGGGAGQNAGYLFEWFEGNLTSGPVVSTITPTNGEVDQLAGNSQYIVRVTRNSTGCRNTASTTLSENIVLPVTSIVVTDQTACAPANGQLVVTVSPMPSQTYTFFWLKEQPMTTTTDADDVITAVNANDANPNRMFTTGPGVNTDTHGNITYGNYTLAVRDNYTNCVSLTSTEMVADETASDITFTIGNRPSACADTDGILEFSAARVDGIPSNFRFEIYLGGPINTVTPIDYNSNPANPFLPDPALNDGTPKPDIAFPQSLGPVGTGINATQGNLASNIYTVIAEDDSGCKSVETFFLPFLDAHGIDALVSNSEICPYTIGDGAISALATPPPTDPGLNQTRYTFTFYEGANPDPANLLALGAPPGPAIKGTEICGNGLDDDGDALIDEGCPYTNPYTWPVSLEDCDDGADNDLDGESDMMDSDCSGRITAGNLAPGFYTIEIQENVTVNNCKVYQVIEVKATALPPVITVNEMRPNTACDLTAADGAIEINVDKDAADTGVGITYNIDMGPDPYGAFPLTAVIGGDYAVSQLRPDTYTFSVLASNGCQASRDFEVFDRPAVSEVLSQNIAITDAEFCDASLETSARAEILHLSITTRSEVCGNGIDDDGDTLVDNADSDCSDNLGNYTFEWYSDPPLSQIILGATSGDNTASNGGEVLSNVGAPAPLRDITMGSYYVVARKIAAGVTGGLGCTSAPIRVDIGDKTVIPVATLFKFDDTSCDQVNFEGSIQVEASTASLGLGIPYTNPGAGSAFRYEWAATNPQAIGSSVGNNGNRSNAEADSDVVAALRPGTYALTVINENTGCQVNVSSAISKISPPSYDIKVTPLAQDLCIASGSIEIDDVLLAGASDGTGNFDYAWYRTDPASSPLEDGGIPVNSTLLNTANYTSIGAGTYYVVATRKPNIGPNNGSGCASAPLRVDIEDNSVNPTVVLTPMANTACDNGSEGSIRVMVTHPGSALTPTYTYDWDAANPTAIGSPVFNNDGDGLGTDGDGDNPADLKDGVYRLTVRNNVSGCITSSETSIVLSETAIVVANATSLPQQICDADGSITVGDISVAGVVESDHGLFDFTWYRDNTTSAPIIAGLAGEDVLDSDNYASVGAGTYYVKAKRTSGAPGSGCESAPIMRVIEDVREFPVVAFSTMANTTCDDLNYDATITVLAETAGFASASNYSFDWTSDPGGSVVITDQPNAPGSYTTAPGDNVGPGVYQITVTNLNNLCATASSVTLLQNTTPVEILDVTSIHQRDCAPFDGSIAIDPNNGSHISIPGTYTFTWEKAGVALAPVPDNMLTGVDAGVYRIVGTKTSGIGAGCVTAPFTVTLQDLTERPVLELKSQANFACDPAMSNGQISAEIRGGPVADYTLQWFVGKNVTSGTVLGTTDILTDQPEGHYTLLAADNVSPGRGCNSSATLAIGFDKTSFSLSVAAADQSLCAPGQNGSVAVTGITEVRNGVSRFASDLSIYGYQWFDDTGVPHASTPAFMNGVTSVNNLLAGGYMVQVTNALGCISAETAALVKDLTVLPAITLENFLNPAICVLPETAGYLQVSADNSLNFSDYTFEWFEGADDSGTLIEPNNAMLADVTYNQPLQYTVRVTNIATKCVSFDTYRFGVDTVQIQVLASSIGRTNCLIENGNLYATTLNGAGASYNYEWYAGPVPSGVPVYTTKEVAGAPIGQYTVIAINPNHDFCSSMPYTTRVTDQRVVPPVVAVQRNPLTYCDPANPNGVAYASVNNGVVGFTFDWFQGAVNGTPIYTGPEVTGLAATTYVVRATDVLTGCEENTSLLIENDPLNVPEPSVVVVRHHTNCVVPDGILSASVSGNTANYLLQWYNGTAVTNLPDQTGEFHRDLEAGFYTTTATDNESGCVSNPVVTEVRPFQENPEFDIATAPTNCEQNIGEASVEILNDVQVSSIEWDLNGVYEMGARISGLPKGEFAVTVTTTQQCSESKTFVIEPEVLVFNGISRNNDGQNDIFEIACIQDFPRNNVKIFNRAGTLVYEANGYDNQDVFFDGVSNRGINLLGTDLPDGTYFYIIDKGNGSKPRTGYLELLR